jgi:hypothetical protein
LQIDSLTNKCDWNIDRGNAGQLGYEGSENEKDSLMNEICLFDACHEILIAVSASVSKFSERYMGDAVETLQLLFFFLRLDFNDMLKYKVDSVLYGKRLFYCFANLANGARPDDPVMSIRLQALAFEFIISVDTRCLEYGAFYESFLNWLSVSDKFEILDSFCHALVTHGTHVDSTIEIFKFLLLNVNGAIGLDIIIRNLIDYIETNDMYLKNWEALMVCVLNIHPSLRDNNPAVILTDIELFLFQHCSNKIYSYCARK